MCHFITVTGETECAESPVALRRYYLPIGQNTLLTIFTIFYRPSCAKTNYKILETILIINYVVILKSINSFLFKFQCSDFFFACSRRRVVEIDCLIFLNNWRQLEFLYLKSDINPL